MLTYFGSFSSILSWFQLQHQRKLSAKFFLFVSLDNSETAEVPVKLKKLRNSHFEMTEVVEIHSGMSTFLIR